MVWHRGRQSRAFEGESIESRRTHAPCPPSTSTPPPSSWRALRGGSVLGPEGYDGISDMARTDTWIGGWMDGWMDRVRLCGLQTQSVRRSQSPGPDHIPTTGRTHAYLSPWISHEHLPRGATAVFCMRGALGTKPKAEAKRATRSSTEKKRILWREGGVPGVVRTVEGVGVKVKWVEMGGTGDESKQVNREQQLRRAGKKGGLLPHLVDSIEARGCQRL